MVPELVERRVGPRRAQGGPAVPGFTPTIDGRERRSGIDRRMVQSRRAYLSDGFQRGWLCFESSGEKRRLTPIPPDWARCREEQLAAYCAQAAHVKDAGADLRQLRSVPGSGDGTSHRRTG